MQIREAKKEDCGALDALLSKLIRDEVQYDPNLCESFTGENNYARQLEQEDRKAFVAEENGEIVGYVYGYVFDIPKMCRRPVAVLDALYVEEAFRNRGIARLLLREFLRFAEAQHAGVIELKVLSENAQAVRLYESMGFSERKKYMTCLLPDTQT